MSKLSKRSFQRKKANLIYDISLALEQVFCASVTNRFHVPSTNCGGRSVTTHTPGTRTGEPARPKPERHQPKPPTPAVAAKHVISS